MGLESFEEDTRGFPNSDGTDSKTRPYVSEDAHQLVQEFSARSGVNITQAYDILLKGVLENDEVILALLETVCNDIDEMNEYTDAILDDLITKIEELDRFPTRDEINEDDRLYGYPIYIRAFGSEERIKDFVNERNPDLLKSE